VFILVLPTLNGKVKTTKKLSPYIQMLGKRKIGQPDTEYESIKTMPIIGIVTNGKWWIFIRHTCQDGSRQLEVSKKLNVYGGRHL
jgi:hypothetical protein